MNEETRDRIRASLVGRRDLQQGLAAAAKVAKQKLNALDLVDKGPRVEVLKDGKPA